MSQVRTSFVNLFRNHAVRVAESKSHAAAAIPTNFRKQQKIVAITINLSILTNPKNIFKSI